MLDAINNFAFHQELLFQVLYNIFNSMWYLKHLTQCNIFNYHYQACYVNEQ